MSTKEERIGNALGLLGLIAFPLLLIFTFFKSRQAEEIEEEGEEEE